MISKSFLKSSFIFTLGGALPMLAGILLLPFYTNYLSDVLYTQLLFYISISMLFQILFSFSIENYFGIKFTQLSDEPEKQKQFIGTTASLLLLIGAGLLVVFSLLGNTIFTRIYNKEIDMQFWPMGFYSVLTGFFNSYFKAASVCLIYTKKPKLFLYSNLINFIVTVSVSVGGLFLFPNTILGPIYGRLLSGLIIFLIGLFIFKTNGNFVFDTSYLKELAAFCTPYLFYVLSGWVLGQLDRYVLQSYIPNAELNAYDLLLKCFFGIEFIQNSLSAVIYPKVYEIWAKNKKNASTEESNRYFNVFTALNILLLIVFCIAVPLVYRLFINNSSFYQAESYLGVVAAGYAMRTILNFYMAGILFAKRIDALLKVFGISAIIQIVITSIAVEQFGLLGAIYVSLFLKILQVLFCFLFTKSVFEFKFNISKIILLPFLFLSLNLLQFIIYKEYSSLFYIFELLVFGFIFYWVFRNEIKKVLSSYNLLPAKK